MPAEPEQLPPKVTNAPPYDVFHNPLMCPITARDLEFRSPTGITLPPRNVLLSHNYYFIKSSETMGKLYRLYFNKLVE
jgi:hypothetical protein